MEDFDVFRAGQAKFQISRQFPRLSGRTILQATQLEYVSFPPEARGAKGTSSGGCEREKESTFVEAAKGIVPTNTKQYNAWTLRAFFRLLGYSMQRGCKPSTLPTFSGLQNCTFYFYTTQ